MAARELATGYVSIVAETSNVPGQLARAFNQGGQRAGDEGGRAAAQGLGGRLQEMLGGKGGMIGTVVGSAFALAGVSAGGLFVSALQKGMEREKAIDLTQARLGLDDATMQKIGFAAGQAYANNFGASVEENLDAARRAIQAGLLDPNATAQETQQIISQMSGVADLLGEEIPAVARAAGQALKTGMAANAKEAFDIFVAAEHAGLNVSEDFLDTMTEYSTQFRKLGLTGKEAIGLMAQATKNGARDTDIAADSLKEFSIRVTDGSKASLQAFTDLGFGAEDMLAKFSAGGASAREATGQVLAELRKIEDPVKKNEVALALFGTQFEDLGDALNHFNLDSAVAELGKVEGAASDALGTMGDNAAGSIESAKRSIEVSTDAISSALAKAFGPELQKLANWVSTHQPEIIGFFGQLADFVLGAADAFLAFSSTSLRALADFADAGAPLLEHFLDPLGKVAEVFGRLTGNNDLANFGKSMQDLESTMGGVADKARDLADGIDNTARPGLDRMRESVNNNVTQMQHAAEVTRALGSEVEALPDGHDIVIKENSPEITARLEALGLKIIQMPNGEFRITANTVDSQRRLDDFIRANSGKAIPVEIALSLSNESRRLAEAAANSGNQTYSQGYVRYAEGGIREPGISNGNKAIVWAEAGPEAYIPLDPSKRDRSMPIWMEVGRRLGLLTMMANGGIAGNRATDWAKSQNGKPYIYGPQDCSWYMSGIYNQLTGKNVRFTTASDLAAFGFKPGSDPSGFTIGTNGGVGENGHMLGRILGTNVESDGTNGVQFGGKADGPESMPKQFYLPRDLWAPPETDDPSRQSGNGGLQLGGLGGSGGGTSPSGTGGLGGSGAGLSGGSGGGIFNGQDVPAGVTPVWVVNLSGSSASGVDQGQQSSSQQFSPEVGMQGTTSGAPMPDVGGRLAKMGSDFVGANIDGVLGDLGFRKSGGAIQAIAQAVFNSMSQALAQAINEMQRSQQGGIVRHAGRPFF